ncbi:hypothetical protein BC834DRAFT_843504 [Gloeopeniophorella convolvens]|nr:hypothetical protein BC834DRAFT_843504 [Gloeopeniophorella convolvens]
MSPSAYEQPASQNPPSSAPAPPDAPPSEDGFQFPGLLIPTWKLYQIILLDPKRDFHQFLNHVKLCFLIPLKWAIVAINLIAFSLWQAATYPAKLALSIYEKHVLVLFPWLPSIQSLLSERFPDGVHFSTSINFGVREEVPAGTSTGRESGPNITRRDTGPSGGHEAT